MTNQQVFSEVCEILDQISLRDQIEVLANALIFMGARGIPGAPTHITKENIAAVVLTDRESNGETLANSLALQGLIMQAWLDE